jgi:DNA-binding CsgD family transcriptional regulator
VKHTSEALAAAVVRHAAACAAADGIAAALEAWSMLTSGAWSIVGDIERAGVRYLVAHRNEPRTGALSELERRACAMAAVACSQKVIAHELGIHPSRVVRHLASGMRKLRTPSVVVLARRFAWLPVTVCERGK